MTTRSKYSEQICAPKTKLTKIVIIGADFTGINLINQLNLELPSNTFVEKI